MAACTSCSATSSGRPRSKRKVMRDKPPELEDSICAKPGIWPNWRSSGEVTSAVMTSGPAPGYKVVTWMVGKSTWGSADTGNSR